MCLSVKWNQSATLILYQVLTLSRHSHESLYELILPLKQPMRQVLFSHSFY
jgi:hypothetical protein